MKREGVSESGESDKTKVKGMKMIKIDSVMHEDIIPKHFMHN